MKQEKSLSGGSCQQKQSHSKSSEGVLWDPLKLLQNVVAIRTGDVQLGQS